MSIPLPDKITVRCCGCTGEVTFVTPKPDEHPTIFHTLPYCKRFEDVNTADDVVRYLQDCGKAGMN